MTYFSTCPKCGKPNNCKMEEEPLKGKQKKEPCWCEKYSLSDEGRKEIDDWYENYGGGCWCEECLN